MSSGRRIRRRHTQGRNKRQGGGTGGAATIDSRNVKEEEEPAPMPQPLRLEVNVIDNAPFFVGPAVVAGAPSVVRMPSTPTPT